MCTNKCVYIYNVSFLIYVNIVWGWKPYFHEQLETAGCKRQHIQPFSHFCLEFTENNLPLHQSPLQQKCLFFFVFINFVFIKKNIIYSSKWGFILMFATQTLLQIITQMCQTTEVLQFLNYGNCSWWKKKIFTTWFKKQFSIRNTVLFSISFKKFLIIYSIYKNNI